MATGVGLSLLVAGLRTSWDRLERGRPRLRPVPALGQRLAVAGLAGTGLGLVRLLLGLWAVRLCRRHGRSSTTRS